MYKETATTGDDLYQILSQEDDKIIVILWFRNEYSHWYLNRENQEIRGTLMNIIELNHPNVEYHEVDMSEYNRNAYTYEELAAELGIGKSDISIICNFKRTSGLEMLYLYNILSKNFTNLIF